MKTMPRWMPLAAMLVAVVHGAKTLGYRFVNEPITTMPVSECPVLTQAPAATPFVAAGDKLHA
jgi:hypothetical protein